MVTPNPQKAREIFEAVGDLALAIPIRHLAPEARQKTAAAMRVLVDHIIEIGEGSHDDNRNRREPQR